MCRESDDVGTILCVKERERERERKRMKPIEWGHKSMADAKKRYEILFKRETLHKLPNWSRFGSSYSPTVGGFGHKNPDD